MDKMDKGQSPWMVAKGWKKGQGRHHLGDDDHVSGKNNLGDISQAAVYPVGLQLRIFESHVPIGDC